MSDLRMTPIFKEITSVVGCHYFSAGYFGRHCERNVLILQHDDTLMLVFGTDDSSRLSLEFVKSISSKGISLKGIQIIGNENVILLLDDSGKLWRLINAFECSDEQVGRLHCLNENCFYEWVSYNKFSLKKVLAVSALGSGFVCIGIHENCERKLLLLPSVESNVIKNYTFEEIISSSSLNFYLTNVRIKNENSDSFGCQSSVEEKLLITDKLNGKTYLCSEIKRNLINYSNDILVNVLHFEEENCFLLCFQSGKLVCHFLNFLSSDSVVYLPKKLFLVEKCCCFASCMLWSDGVCLHHSKLVFQHFCIKLIHLKLECNIIKPLWLSKFERNIVALSVNNIYYLIQPGHTVAEKIQRHPEELLSEMYEGSLSIHQLNTKTEAITHFLHCKEIMEGSDLKKKVDMNMELDSLILKFYLGVTLRKNFWKLKLVTSVSNKKFVKMIELETDVSEGMLMRVKSPFKSRVRVILVGDFDGETLSADLGEIGESENDISDLSMNLRKILLEKNLLCSKE